MSSLLFSADSPLRLFPFLRQAVCIYWVTSNLFTLVQNVAFFIIDRRREEAKRMGDILSGRAAMKAVIRVRR